MKRFLVLSFLSLMQMHALSPMLVYATWDEWEDDPNVGPIISDQNKQQFNQLLNRYGLPSVLTPSDQESRRGAQGLISPAKPNAYAPGLNSDATGRPFYWAPSFGGIGGPDSTLKVTPNAYGPGVGMDQYGRPVQPRAWP